MRSWSLLPSAAAGSEPLALIANDGDVGVRIGLHIGGLKLAAVVHRTVDFAAASDDVIVRQNDARRVDEDARAGALPGRLRHLELAPSGSSSKNFFRNGSSSRPLGNWSPKPLGSCWDCRAAFSIRFCQLGLDFVADRDDGGQHLVGELRKASESVLAWLRASAGRRV